MRICTHHVWRMCVGHLRWSECQQPAYLRPSKGVVVWAMLIDLVGVALRLKSQGNQCFAWYNL